MLENKYSFSKSKLALFSLGTILATTLTSNAKASADGVAQNSSSVQVAKTDNVKVTSAQCAYYQHNQQKDNQALAKAKDEAQKQAQAEQKQSNNDSQNNNAQTNVTNNNSADNNSVDNNSVDNNTQQGNSAPANAVGDNALKVFNDGVSQKYNQQSQKNNNDNAKIVQQQQQANQQAGKDLNKKVQDSIQAKTVAVANDSIGENDNKSNNQAPTGSGSVYDQFIQAGGTPDMWKYIVLPESSGNPDAVNGRYSGLFQTDKGNGTRGHSVAEQTKWAIQYANERYGSVENAIHFRQTHNWW